MPIEPISTVATIIAFIDAIQKIKGTIDKVSENKGRFRQIKKEIIRELTELETFCLNRHGSLDENEAKELKQGLDSLRNDLIHVAECTERYLNRSTTGVLASATAGAKAWLGRRGIEREVVRLEKHIQTCHMRFLTSTSARTEHTVIVHHLENRTRMENLDDMLSHIIIRNYSPVQPTLEQPIEPPLVEAPVRMKDGLSIGPAAELDLLELLKHGLGSIGGSVEGPMKGSFEPPPALEFDTLPNRNTSNSLNRGGTHHVRREGAADEYPKYASVLEDRNLRMAKARVKESLVAVIFALVNFLCCLISLLWYTGRDPKDVLERVAHVVAVISGRGHPGEKNGRKRVSSDHEDRRSRKGGHVSRKALREKRTKQRQAANELVPPKVIPGHNASSGQVDLVRTGRREKPRVRSQRRKHNLKATTGPVSSPLPD
ncbi:hypothetical protein HGRIS_007246 [Hohenbuehelia grisea]|uniref:Uncharacterized protein n=1 Tax=Hohenbuehelia grisea TaxID=104357 RepID=A0ABR3JBH5_9AGAR